MDTSSRNVRRVTLVGSVVAAIAASACCLGPAILALIGLSGVGLAAKLEPLRPLFLALTAALLAVGFYVTYRRQKVATSGSGSAAGEACDCERPTVARSGRVMLWIATVLVVAFAAYPYVAGAVARRSERGPVVSAVRTQTVRLRVEGMSCASCASHITEALAKTPGVIRSDVDVEGKSARVDFDSTKANAQAIAQTIDGLGYHATLWR